MRKPSLLRNKKHCINKLDLVNEKPIPFGDRGVSELTASVLVPRGICPDLLGEQCWDQKQLCIIPRKQISICPRLSDESPAEEADPGDAAATAQFSCLLVQLRASLWLWLFPWEGLFQGTAVKL